MGPCENDQSRSLPERSVETRGYKCVLVAYQEAYRSAECGPRMASTGATPKAVMDIDSASATLGGLADDIGNNMTNTQRRPRHTIRRGEQLTDWS
jgi:hypothetical protein